MTSKRDLARQLGVVEGFESPRAELEQYRTQPEIAATLVHTAGLHGDIGDHLVVDLGCGTGMLALAASLCGPEAVIGVDIDAAVLASARANEQVIGPESTISWVRGDVTRAPLCRRDCLAKDEPVTIVTNPPFGAQDGNKHADRAFLATASELADVSYSIHNAGSSEFVDSFTADNGGEVTHAFAAELDLPNAFGFHEHESKAIDVEIFRIVWAET
jgi:putative methylase